MLGGGGGGAGGGGGNNQGNGGGGGGEYAIKTITNPNSSYTYSVGAAGVGGSSSSDNATNGGDSTFGSTIVVAKGGSKGNWISGGLGTGGAGGTGGTGDTTRNGGRGGDNLGNSAGGGGGGAGTTQVGGDAVNAVPGIGGTLDGGNGGAGGEGRDVAGSPGNTFGGGGGSSTRARSGANGAVGSIRVTYTIVNDPPTVALNTADGNNFGNDTTPTLEFTGTDNEGDDIEYQIQIDTSNTFATASTYYFDSSDATIADPNSVWGNDSYGFDGSISTSTYTSTSGDTSSNYIMGEGTNSPTTGGSISQVRARLYNNIEQGATCYASIYTDALGEILGEPYHSSINAGYGDYVTLSTPTGGWTWQKINDLEVKAYRVGASFSVMLSIVEVEVTTSVLIDKDSTTDTGFVNTVDGGDTHPFTSGQKVSYTVQEADALGYDTYYWRVRGKDPSGTNTYGEWSSTRSFIIESGISIVLTTDGQLDYGIINAGSQKSTLDITETQTVQNSGTSTIDLRIKTSNAIGTQSDWTLGSSTGSTDVYVHEFSINSGTDWTQFTTADTYQTMTTSLGASNSQNFDLRITVPTTTTHYDTKDITITIQGILP